MVPALRSISDRLFDRLATRKGRSRAVLALAVPALVTSLAVTVHPGDTLSGLAAKYCGGHSGDWTGIYQANKAVIGANPNLILPGQHLTVKCTNPGWSAPAPTNVGSSGGSSNESGPSGGSSPVTASAVYTGSTGFQQCVISRESGGNSQIWNASGHYGLYQFSYSTWVAYGGAPGDFGHASAAEQTQVFDAAMATPNGASNWAPYDGC